MCWYCRRAIASPPMRRWCHCVNLSTDESLLTGESVPVRKTTWDGTSAIVQPGGDGQPFVFAGTLVTRGHGIAVVQRVGAHTEIGTIGKALQTVAPERSALAARDGPTGALARGHRRRPVRAGGARLRPDPRRLAERLPRRTDPGDGDHAERVSRGADRLPGPRRLAHLAAARADAARAGARDAGRRPPCCASTRPAPSRSTRCRCASCSPAKADLRCPVGPADAAARRGSRAGRVRHPRQPARPVRSDGEGIPGSRRSADSPAPSISIPNWTLVRQYPLSEQLLALSHVWRSPDGHEYVIAAKGAPEAIADLCHLSAAQQATLLAQVENDGCRRPARARRGSRMRFAPDALPTEQHDFAFELWASSGSPTRCATTCRTRSRSATRPVSAWR